MQPLPLNKVLVLPSSLAAEHAAMFRNGVVTDAWDKADAVLAKATLRRRFLAREERDEIRDGYPLPGDQNLLQECSLAADKVTKLVARAATVPEIGLAADKAAGLIFAAINNDLLGAPDLTDDLEGVVDVLTARPDLQFCVPQTQIALALAWALDGEPEAARSLLSSTIRVLNEVNLAGTAPALVARNLALAYCASSDLCHAEGKVEQRLLAVKKAWMWALRLTVDAKASLLNAITAYSWISATRNTLSTPPLIWCVENEQKPGRSQTG